MRKLLLSWISCFVLIISLRAQSLQQSADDAYMISRMAEKFHVQPRPLDDSLSSALFLKVLDELDDQRIFFTREDIARLSVYQFRLGDEIRDRQTDFLKKVINLYQQRVTEADTMIDHITGTPFNFHIREQFTAAEIRPRICPCTKEIILCGKAASTIYSYVISCSAKTTRK